MRHPRRSRRADGAASLQPRSGDGHRKKDLGEGTAMAVLTDDFSKNCPTGTGWLLLLVRAARPGSRPQRAECHGHHP